MRLCEGETRKGIFIFIDIFALTTLEHLIEIYEMFMRHRHWPIDTQEMATMSPMNKLYQTWKEDSRCSINQRHRVYVLLRPTCRFPQPLLTKVVIADETIPELLPLGRSRRLCLRRSLHRRQMWMRSRLRTGNRRIVSILDVGLVVDRTNHRVTKSIVEIQESLGRVASRHQRVVQISANLFDLLDILPLFVFVWNGNFSAANFREVMNASELQQGCDAVEKAHEKKPIECSCITNFRQVGSRVKRDRR